MFSHEMIKEILDVVVMFASDLLLPVMFIGFFVAVSLRALIYFTVKRHDWFAKEFEKRVNKFLEETDHKARISFFVTVKKLLERTYYEVFEVRAIMKRRNPDVIMDKSDRLFLIKQGCAWFVRDLTKQVQYLKYERIETQPKLLHISRSSFQRNPAFNKIFGSIPAAPINDMISILPSMFVVAGILGTFMGVMKALPELGGMDLSNADQAKGVMDRFLINLAFSMSASVVGIIFSIGLSFFNTVCSPDKAFSEIIERFEGTLDLLWHRADNNQLPEHIADFDENRDPIEALAEESINQELLRTEPNSGKSAPNQRPPPPPKDKAS